MATPSEDELEEMFDERIYEMIESNPTIINDNWEFDFGDDRAAATRRNLGENDVMVRVMMLEGWGRDQPWGQPSEVVFNLGKRLNLYGKGLSYENFIKAINDYRIRNMGRQEEEKSAELFARFLGAPGGLIAEIARDRAARDAAGAAANAQNDARAGDGIDARLGGAAPVQYRRHGRAHGYYSRASPGAFTAAQYRQNRAGALDKVVGTGGQGVEQGNESGRYVRALPRVAEAALPKMAAHAGRGDSGSPAK